MVAAGQCTRRSAVRVARMPARGLRLPSRRTGSTHAWPCMHIRTFARALCSRACVGGTHTHTCMRARGDKSTATSMPHAGGVAHGRNAPPACARWVFGGLCTAAARCACWAQGPACSAASPPPAKPHEASTALTQLCGPSLTMPGFMGLCLNPPTLVSEYCPRGALFDILQQARTTPAVARQLDWRKRLSLVRLPAAATPTAGLSCVGGGRGQAVKH